MVMRTVWNQPRTNREELVNNLKAAGTLVTKNTVGTALRHDGLKSPCPLAQESICTGLFEATEHLNVSQEDWVKVTKIECFVINSTCRFWRTRMLPMTPKTLSPPSNMEMETLGIGVSFC